MAKSNSKPRKRGLPDHLKEHCFKPGNDGNVALRRKRRPDVIQCLKDMLPDEVKLEDGRIINKAEAIAKILMGKMLRGPNPEGTHDSDWQFASQQVLSRVAPVPREPLIDQRTVNISATVLAQGFTEQLREHVGRDNITSGDVLDALESDAFATSDSPPGSADD